MAQRIVTHDCRLNASSQRLHSHDPRFFVTVQLKIRISQSHGLTLILECAIGEAIAKESLIRFECPLIIGA